jgi:hypothetical protein
MDQFFIKRMAYYPDALEVARKNGCYDVTTFIYRVMWLYGLNMTSHILTKALGIRYSTARAIMRKVGIVPPPRGHRAKDNSTRYMGHPCTANPAHIFNGKTERYKIQQHCVACAHDRYQARKQMEEKRAA